MGPASLAPALDACAVSRPQERSHCLAVADRRPSVQARTRSRRSSRCMGAVPVAAVHASGASGFDAGAVRIALASAFRNAPTARHVLARPAARGAHRPMLGVLAAPDHPRPATRAEAAPSSPTWRCVLAQRTWRSHAERRSEGLEAILDGRDGVRRRAAARYSWRGTRAARSRAPSSRRHRRTPAARRAHAVRAHPWEGPPPARSAATHGAVARSRWRRGGGARVAEGVAWASRRLAPRSTPPRVADDAHAVVRAIAPAEQPGEGTRARDDSRSAPPLEAHAPS